MPIHPQDLQDFIAMFGEQLIPSGFEEEYNLWLAMKHRRNSSGPLGDLMIPLCRKFNLTPKIAAQSPKQVLWRAVERGTAVIVTLNGVPAKGKYLGLGSYGEVEVLIDGQTWVQAVKPFQVELDMALTLPADLKLTQSEKEAMQPFAAEAVVDSVATEDFPAHDPAADLVDDDAEIPEMADARWYEAKSGDRLIVEIGDDMPDAEFVRLGENDGEIVVLVDGEEVSVSEGSVEFV